MVDRQMTIDGESGTSLAELLVVMLLLGVVGAITTVGIVQGFGAQLTATNVSETLDGTRIATQRVRDFVRGATEVCANSTATSLVLWTDDDSDGGVVDTELDIFELVTDASGTEVFQRRTPTASGDIVQLIRDDIINAALFSYDAAPAAQPDDLACTQSVTPSNGPNRTRVVNVQFTVANPDPAKPDLSTQTSVRLRNAALVESSANVAPTAQFSVACLSDDRTCTLDAADSSDPDGAIESYTWAYDNAGTAVPMDCDDAFAVPLDERCTFTFPVGDVAYDVTLTVTDSFTAMGTRTKAVTPVEPGSAIPPSAAFTFTCTGLICNFDATSSVDDDPIVSYAWQFANLDTATGATVQYTFPTDGEYAVTLTVTDADGLTSSETRSVTASTNTIFVSSLTGSSGGSGNNRFGEFTAQLSRTVGGNPGAGLTITITVEDNKGGVHTLSCTTGSTGSCLDAVTGLQGNKFPLVATVTSVTNTGSWVYDEDQNTDDTETVS